MNKIDFNGIWQLAKAGNKDELAAMSHDLLVEFAVRLSKSYEAECGQYSKQMDVVENLHRELLHKADMGEFTHRMRDMERQLTETENERDNIMATKKVLEDELHQLRARVDELEQRLASIPKAGRPDVYDADFRARVKEYYNNGHTYRETANKFGISTNTVGRILKE
jgi:hypothetical protein